MQTLTPVTIDFETYYDTEYSLQKIKTPLFVRDARFQVHGAGIKVGELATAYFRAGDELENALKNIPWANTRLVGHNLRFDALILSHHYGYTAKEYFDTRSLCAPILPSSVKKDLDSCAKALLNADAGKISGLSSTKGLRVLPEDIHRKLGEYCIRDVDLAWELYKKYHKVIPEKEQYLMHITTRMASEPVLQLNTELLAYEVQRLKDQRDELLRQCPVSKTVLSSNPKFVQWMQANGMKVPMKESPTTGKQTPALANDDLGYRELQADYPQFKAVWDARRVVKSTIGLTRAEAFLKISQQGTMPMPLNYYGAHTGRWSGADGLNVQNLPRIIPNDPDSGAIRRSITAPDGYVVLVLDLSQIELRLNAWFCHELEKLDVLRSGGDVYLYAASNHYGYTCNKQEHPQERFFGKMLELALGYNMGWRKLRVNAALGFMGTPPVHLTRLEAQKAVYKWRSKNQRTADTWENLNSIIYRLQRPDSFLYDDWLKMGSGTIKLPNGMTLFYPRLRWSTREEAWLYDNGKKLYGGIMLENIIQALGRVVIADHMYIADHRKDIHVVGMTHDEIIALVPEDRAEIEYDYLLDVMTTPPTWAEDLPLDAEGGFAKNYVK
jgi:DNA polymerase